MISHDWPDEPTKKVLKHLRSAAKPTTNLILADQIVPYSAPTQGSVHGIPGSAVDPVPEPLLPNLGVANMRVYLMDMQVGASFVYSLEHISDKYQMMSVLNAQERTIGQFMDLVDGTGWKLHSISRGVGGAASMLIFNTVS